MGVGFLDRMGARAVEDDRNPGLCVVARVGIERHAGSRDRLAHDTARVPAKRLRQLRPGGRRGQRLGEQDTPDRDLGVGVERRRPGDHRAQLGLDRGRIFFRDHAPVEAEDDAIRHDVGVDPARDEANRHLRRADARNRGGPRLKPAAPAVEGAEDRIRRFERVDPGRGPGGMRRAAKDLDLEMQTAVVGVDDGVGEARADGEVRPRQPLLEKIARTDLAARLLVISDVQFDRAVERRAALVQRQHRKGVSGDVRLRHRRPAADHPAVDDLGPVGVVRPACARRHNVAMGIERDCRAALPEPAPDDQIGRRNHPVGLDQVIRNLVPLDGKPQSFQKPGDGGGGGIAIPRRIVGRNLDDLGEEARFRFGLRLNERMDCTFDRRHRNSPQSTGQASNPSTLSPS